MAMATSLKPVVRAVHCDWRADDETVYQALKRATQPLTRAWDKLRNARRIAIKFNQDKEARHHITFHHHRVQLVSDCVARATLRLLRENTSAQLYCVDVSFYRKYVPQAKDEDTTQLRHVLREFDVTYIDGNVDVVWASVPGGGLMFDRYPVTREFADMDAWVSVQKLKNHAFMGVTLCMKNLFGLMPTEPLGRPRTYYHHLVRMPYVLADLGRLYDPALNIIDGLVCQAGEEWGRGEEMRIANTLIAGDHVVATDAVGAYLMGHDPARGDWKTEPFHRDRNALRVAAESGFGTVNLDEMDFVSEVTAPVGDKPFFAKITDAPEIVHSWRKTTAEQGLYYRDHREDFIRRYAGEYILLQMGEVKWHDPSGTVRASRRILSGDHPEQAMWMKYVDPDEAEGEHFEVYERTLDEIRALESA
ncbi:MAG: DUF362 domain-containing protein [Chloroflexi bacterium]|uniref:DUF362 domain-containing protein n=2 Tax=Candidatus Thermofonsia Clade 3 TaxID=2364209 RepID=A0A2M8QCZ3_9CHLR|nr:MAG: hypothetical protein CUN48_07555 [Candidatus Thermofonsia Clade 3 bacterium]RMG63095.1 MAG: DUF362 domain-containing protein [Chloroflexota bacterium]